jgi:hypothetical protein
MIFIIFFYVVAGMGSTGNGVRGSATTGWQCGVILDNMVEVLLAFNSYQCLSSDVISSSLACII